VAVLAADHISNSVAEQVKRFALQNAPNVGVGIIDAGGFRSFIGHGLESLNAERSESPGIDLLAKRPSAANLFSDLNQWMLKILLSEEIPESMLSAPRGRYGNASQLAAAAGVSVMSAFRSVRQLSEEGFLEDKGVLRLVRIEDLLERWLAANQRRAREIPVRWIIRGDKSQLHVALRSYLSKMEARSPRQKRSHGGRLLKASPRICLGLFAAADVFGFGFVHLCSTAKPVDVARDPTDVPPAVGNRKPTVVHVTLEAEEVAGTLYPSAGTTYRYWTFNGKVPGPMIRVRQGDTVEVTLRNDASSHLVGARHLLKRFPASRKGSRFRPQPRASSSITAAPR
jgi:hypothetical protein